MRIPETGVVLWGVICLCVPGCRTRAGGDFIPPDFDVLFRDEFDDETLDAGWTFAGEDPTRQSLTGRSGFMRIYAQELADDPAQTRHSLLLRERNGDFVLLTRMEFDPAADRLLAGLVVQGEDGRMVSLGLLHASRSGGTFRGVLALADPGGGMEVDRVAAASELTDVYLRLERRADDFEVSYSADGVTYTRVGTVTASLSDTVQVGIGVAASENCNSQCDVASPADFGFFEIGAVDNTG
jgi:beta-xylosidase